MITNKLTFHELRTIAPAVFATDPHPRVSERYHFYPTFDIVTPLLSENWFITRAGQAKSKSGQTKSDHNWTTHFVALTQPALIHGGEQIEALLFNSHDGRKRLHFELGIFRSICTNGCIWADDTFGELNLRHVHYPVEEVHLACQKVAARAPEIAQHIADWKRFECSPAQAAALAQFGLSLRWSKRAPIAAERLLFVRRSEDEKPSLWNVYNRIQEALIKGGDKYSREGGKRHTGTTRAIFSIDTGLSLNKRLWEGAHAISQGMALPA